MNWSIREEREDDAGVIRGLTRAAFEGKPYSDGSEAGIIDALRHDGDLTLSLVAENAECIIGHIAFSPVSISDGTRDWYGLGPVSVLPSHQRSGIGSALITNGLKAMKTHGARGIVLLGSTEYYPRFGFVHDPKLAYPGPPPEYFQRYVIAGPAPSGKVRYAPAFG